MIQITEQEYQDLKERASKYDAMSQAAKEYYARIQQMKVELQVLAAQAASRANDDVRFGNESGVS